MECEHKNTALREKIDRARLIEELRKTRCPQIQEEIKKEIDLLEEKMYS
jgi:hypothetical protein